VFALRMTFRDSESGENSVAWKLFFWRLGKQFAGTILLFSFLVATATAIWMLVASSVGYLPYSDRPGVGWKLTAHWPSFAEIGSYLGFIPFFVILLWFFGAAFFVLAIVLGLVSLPRWSVRVIGGVVGLATAGMGVAGAGWYIALSGTGPLVGAVAGLVYGVFLFPLFVVRRERLFPLWVRLAVAILAPALILFWVVSPLLPRAPVPALNYDVLRITPGDKLVADQMNSYDSPTVREIVRSLQIRGQIHSGIGGASAGDNNVPGIQVQVYLLEPIREESKLALPQGGVVVYVLRSGHWTATPANFVQGKQFLTIRPLQSHEGREGLNEGGEVKVGNGKFEPFHCYPVIPAKP
jgi:hypothetical protein